MCSMSGEEDWDSRSNGTIMEIFRELFACYGNPLWPTSCSFMARDVSR